MDDIDTTEAASPAESEAPAANLTIPADSLPGDCKPGDVVMFRLGEQGEDGGYPGEFTGKQHARREAAPESESLGGDY